MGVQVPLLDFSAEQVVTAAYRSTSARIVNRSPGRVDVQLAVRAGVSLFPVYGWNGVVARGVAGPAGRPARVDQGVSCRVWNGGFQASPTARPEYWRASELPP